MGVSPFAGCKWTVGLCLDETTTLRTVAPNAAGERVKGVFLDRAGEWVGFHWTIRMFIVLYIISMVALCVALVMTS